MIYKHLITLLALSFLAGKAVSQVLDYTLTNPVPTDTNPVKYVAAVAESVVTFTGSSVIKQALATTVFSQAFKQTVTAAGGGVSCSDTDVATGITKATTGEITVTALAVDLKFNVDLKTIPASVYTSPTLTFCHRITLTSSGGLAVNVVDTIITATINLSATFGPVSIETQAPTVGTASNVVNIASTLTATTTNPLVKPGQPVEIKVASTTYKIDSITATFGAGFEVLPTAPAGAKYTSTAATCAAKECTFTLTLGFDFFKNAGTLPAKVNGGYQLSGTATISLLTTDRRHLQQQQPAEEEVDVPFALTIYEGGDVDSGASTRMVATAFAGGIMALMAVV